MICFGYCDLPCRNDDLLFLDHGIEVPITYGVAVEVRDSPLSLPLSNSTAAQGFAP